MFYVGIEQTVRSEFTDDLGALFDPTAVELHIRKPSSDVSDITGGSIVHDSLGKYHTTYTPDTPGVYKYLWIGRDGGGDPIAAGGGSFTVSDLTV